MATQNELREQITQRIIDALSSGSLPPWRRPWRAGTNTGSPVNVVSGKPYRGVNPMLLRLSADRHRLASKFWGTFRQWQQVGGRVKRRPSDVPEGQWGTHIVVWLPLTKSETEEHGNEEEKTFFFMKSFVVFNADQVDGVEHLQSSIDDTTNGLHEACDRADELIEATGADIRFVGDKAFYSPDQDFIQCPPRTQFADTDEYYETLFHELTHWTEHESRLAWNRRGEGYAMGELIAEISSCYVANELGIPNSQNVTNHAAYLEHWLSAMKGDSRFIFTASTQASKAADYILAFERSKTKEHAFA
jgi:antirestriction protein ArdC